MSLYNGSLMDASELTTTNMLSPLAENIAKKMLVEADREINRLRQINQELTFENSKLKAQLKPNEQLREEIQRAKETIALLMKKVEKK